MKIGFTGTQEGMTENQLGALKLFLLEHEEGHFHHGDCVGADFQAATLAKTLDWWVVGHPPDSDKKRAFFCSDFNHPAMPYLERNQAIVNDVDILVAAPKTEKEQLRSGTWATIRYARKRGIQIVILKP